MPIINAKSNTKKPKFIAVLSQKGGGGKSTLSRALAMN